MNRKTIDVYMVTYDKFDHDFNLIAQGVIRGFNTQEEAFNLAMRLNLYSIRTETRNIFKVEFKRYRKDLKSHILASVSDDRLNRIFNQ